MKSIRVYLSNGTDYVTSVNGTDEEIRNYFVGEKFVQSDEVTFLTCHKIEFI